MIVIKNHTPNEDPINYLGFENFSELGKNCLFFYGGHPNNSFREPSDLPKYFFSTEEQGWDRDSTDNYVDYFETIFTICPPSFTNRKKRKSAFFPFPEEFIPQIFEKLYDVIYTGFASAEHINEIINTITKFNYRFVSFGGNMSITDTNVSYARKIQLISQSKITVVHNLIGNNTPQLKTRPFEAAFCKSLILCKKDDFNIIEEWFEPNKEFIYYENKKDLEETISKVINNYESFKHIIENAYKKAINNYTTKHFVQKYLT